MDDKDAVLSSPWVAAEGPRVQREIKDLARYAVRGTASPAKVIVRACTHPPSWTRDAWHLPAPLAERWLREPVVVLVENARTDGAFLRLVALRVGANKLKRILGEEEFLRLSHRWASPLGDRQLIHIRHGGGRETATQLKLLVEAGGTPPPRVLVFLDSDRHASNVKAVGPTAAAVQATAAGLPANAAGWKVEPFILDKHEVENYIPHEAIWQEYPKVVIPDPDFTDLKTLFGNRLARSVFGSEKAQRYLHERALRERCGQRGVELDRLVTALCDLL